MKKIIPAVIVLAVLAIVGLMLIKRVVAHRSRAAELVPAETILFAQIPDTITTVQRFTGTAIYKIFQEPEMQRFLEKSRQKNPFGERWEEFNRRLLKVIPREGFAAVTSIDGPVPSFVGGFAFSGRQKDAEELVAEWRSSLRQMWPAGKADLVSYGSREVETFSTKDFTIAEVFADGWYLVASDLALLQRTIDRLDGKGDTGPSSLARSEIYRDAIAPLPTAPDAMLVGQLGTVMDRLTALLIASGQKPDSQDLAKLKNIKAIAAATKFDGTQCRDTIFVLSPGSSPEPPLARSTLALSSSATLLYYAMALPATVELSEQTVPMLALVPGWLAFSKALADRQLTLADFPKAFGPELGSLLDWQTGAASPTFVLALDVRDRAKAAAFLDIVASGQLGSPVWTKTEQPGTTLLSLPSEGFGMVSPTVALTDRFVVIGLTGEAVSKALGQAATGPGPLAANANYLAAAKSVTAPTAGFAYVDLGNLFERAYGVFKPLLAMSLAFSPDAAQYLDAGKLPSPETISKHLGPIAYSQATSAHGTLVESTGPLTLNQVLVGVAAGAISAALPTMQAALSSGSLLDPSQLLQGFGGGNLPTSSFPANEPSAAPVEAPIPTSVPLPDGPEIN